MTLDEQRFAETAKQETRPTLCVDFDGVIHRYSKGWHDGTIYDAPVWGAADALAQLIKTFRIVVFSCRAFSGPLPWGGYAKSQAAEIERYLQIHLIPYDEVWTYPWKPNAHAYIDDKSIEFRGDWGRTVQAVKSFRSWAEPVETLQSVKEENAQLRRRIAESESRIAELEDALLPAGPHWRYGKAAIDVEVLPDEKAPHPSNCGCTMCGK